MESFAGCRPLCSLNTVAFTLWTAVMLDTESPSTMLTLVGVARFLARKDRR